MCTSFKVSSSISNRICLINNVNYKAIASSVCRLAAQIAGPSGKDSAKCNLRAVSFQPAKKHTKMFIILQLVDQCGGVNIYKDA